MKKLLFISILIVTAINLQAQPMFGWTSSTPKLKDIGFLPDNGWWGIDIFCFSVQFYDNNNSCLLGEPVTSTSYSHGEFLHNYHDIIGGYTETETEKGISAWAIYVIPPLNMPKGLKALYIGVGFGLNTSYDIVTTTDVNYHEIAPTVTLRYSTETTNKKRIPSLNLNLRYNILDFIDVGEGEIFFYACPTLTISTYTKIKPTVGFAIGFGLRQRDTVKNWF